MKIHEELQTIATILNDNRIPYALCGDLALALHGCPRATQDIDILIREKDLKRILNLADTQGFKIRAGIIKFHEGKKSETRVYRVSKIIGEEISTLDFVLLSPVLKDVWEKRETYIAGDYELSSVSVEGLKKMKKLSGRLQDLADLEKLNQRNEDEKR